MKKIFVLLMFALFSASAFADGKTLIVYFSLHKNQEHILTDADSGARTLWHGEIQGNNAILAQMIGGKIGGADIMSIEVEEKYDDDRYGKVVQKAKEEQQNRARVRLKTKVNTSGYDTIIMGYPIWWKV